MKPKLKPADVDLLALLLRLTALVDRIEVAHKEHLPTGKPTPRRY